MTTVSDRRAETKPVEPDNHPFDFNYWPQTWLSLELDGLKPRERYILVSFFGIGRPAQSLRQIGRELGVTHQAVARVKDTAVATIQRRMTLPGMIEQLKSGDLSVDLAALGLSRAIESFLKNHRIYTVEDLLAHSRRRLEGIRWLGKGWIAEITQALGRYNLGLRP